MKKYMYLLVFMMIFNLSTAYAETESIKINLSNELVTINGKNISTDTTKGIFLSNKMNIGVESEENQAIDKIININAPGIYEFTGVLDDGQIAINANNIKGDVKIVLNNANINCKKAPAIFVYSKNTEQEDCKVTISTVKDTINNITGNRTKISVLGWENQENIQYYIAKETDEGEYIEECKYNGAISSDISLTFNGEGILNITSTKKEGIECKMHITFDSGEVYISSLDDAVNANGDGKSIVTINSGILVANILSDAEEGDGIDSNGYIYINGGTVYAFAHPGADSGIDSDLGTYVNDGTVFETGDMHSELRTTNDNKIIQVQLRDGVKAGENLVIADKQQNVVFAYKADRDFSTFAYTSDLLENKEYEVYTGTTVEGTVNANNIYTEIKNINFDKLTKQEINFDMRRVPQNLSVNNVIGIICLIVAGILLIVGIIASVKTKERIRVVYLVGGIIIGALAVYGVMSMAPDNRNNFMSDTRGMEIPFRENIQKPSRNFDVTQPVMNKK